MSARADPATVLAARARGDLAALAVAVAALAAVVLKDALVAIPQGLAGVAVLVAGARAERLALPLAGRLALLGAAAAFAWLPAGEPPAALARFLSGIAAASLLRPKASREHGFTILLLLLETALAAALSLHWSAAPAGLLLACLFHRAVGSWHRQRAAGRAAAAGGPVLRVEDGRRTRRAADLAALTALVVAAPIFLVLPRTDIPLLRVPGVGGGTEPGVGDEVRLGRLGPVSDADEVVGRVAPQDAQAQDAEPYFRAVALEAFDGTRWSAVEGQPHPRAYYDRADGVVGLGRPSAAAPRWLFVVEAAASPRLPLPEGTATVRFEDPVPRDVRVDAAETLRPVMDRATLRWVYAAAGARKPRGERPSAAPSPTAREGPPEVLRRELAPAVDAALAGLESASPRDRAERLTAWVRDTAAYDLFGGPGGENPVGDFLFRVRRGHCEHFAAALAMALREAGIPSRLVAGYHASRWNDVGRFWVLRRRDAHAWVEAWIPGEGWARFDATPPTAREPDPYEGVAGFLARLRDAAAFAWNRTVLGYDRDAQRGTFESLRDLVQGVGPALRRGAVVLGGLVLVAAILWVGVRVGRRRRARAGPEAAAGFYGEALRILARRGVVRRPSETAEDLATRVADLLPPTAACALDEITGVFGEVRYGGRQPPGRDVVDDWLSRLRGDPPSSRRPALVGE